MGALIIIVPIVIYYYLIKWLFNKYYKDTNKTKRKIYFILLVTLPFWDHMAGYAYYKYLCYTNGGVKIYKTVTDLQEQKDYWFYEGLNVVDNSFNDKQFKYLSKNGLVKREIQYKIKEKEWALKMIYLNYCNNKYNNLPTTHKNYKNSCTNADKLIKKYDLKNVIKVPRSLYIVSSSEQYKNKYLEKNFIMASLHKVLPFGFGLTRIVNIKTNQTMGEYMNFSLRHGWYVDSLLNIVGYKSTIQSMCSYYGNRIKLQEKVIPNPYKQNNKITQGK